MKPSRRLRRFFVSARLLQVGGIVSLTCPETNHLKNILRLQQGDRCLVMDGAGQEAEACVLRFLEDGRTELKIETLKSHEKTRPKCALRVYLAIPQKGKMDYLVEKAQEWGVEEIHPIETQRTLVKMSEPNKVKTMARWTKIAQEAGKQSGSLTLVKIHAPVSFPSALGAIEAPKTMALFHPAKDAISFREWVDGLEANEAGPFNLFFGPEGGFTEREVESAVFKGAVKVHLGENILKVDTAFLGVISALRLVLS